jgi:hypothetical protein
MDDFRLSTALSRSSEQRVREQPCRPAAFGPDLQPRVGHELVHAVASS